MVKSKSSIDSEINKFSNIAEDWWKNNGKFKVLHNFNKVRVAYIKNILDKHNLSNIEILDIGCGGGILSESFSKLDYKLIGIDASLESILAAKKHAQEGSLDIEYINILPEDYLEKNPQKKFKVIFAMEIIEHVSSPENFIKTISQLLEKDGILFFSTINRNLKSLVLAKYTAEYILNWIPKQTHDYNKFIKPSELNHILSKCSLELHDIKGIKLHPISRDWNLSLKPDVNYIGYAKKI
ncbi:MAG: bifunctional 2-polyprenyl-6-hydroxyphenol methylase/3-demethylubiquinol 3-O-methyltransferase UbiG [Alphaproteobacteria bacterium]|nr:bifunctional 2-polyprenyl-6-hydroxyphenol methylase/3-demethylubiquinol 3-O-methyltransferase UbiG [Alphaproteobacteria bacterium]